MPVCGRTAPTRRRVERRPRTARWRSVWSAARWRPARSRTSATRNRRAAGGRSTATATTGADVDSTAAAIQALVAANVPVTDADLKAGLVYLANTRQPGTGAWQSFGGDDPELDIDRGARDHCRRVRRERPVLAQHRRARIVGAAVHVTAGVAAVAAEPDRSPHQQPFRRTDPEHVRDHADDRGAPARMDSRHAAVPAVLSVGRTRQPKDRRAKRAPGRTNGPSARADRMAVPVDYQSGRQGSPLRPPSARTASTWWIWLRPASKLSADPAM